MKIDTKALWRTGAHRRGVRLLLGGMLGMGLHSMASAEFVPTRMQRCTADLAGITGEATRKSKLSECLNRRLDAERIVERECRKQVASVPTENQAERIQLQQDCVSRSLQKHYAELPRRPAAPPKPAADATANSGAATLAAPVTPVAAPATPNQ